MRSFAPTLKNSSSTTLPSFSNRSLRSRSVSVSAADFSDFSIWKLCRRVYTTQGECIDVHNPSGLPPATLIDHIEEPYIRAQVISKADFYGPIMKLCLDKRGTLIGQHYITSDRLELTYEMPLSEIVFDFYDKLKSISKGYASFDYHIVGFKDAKLVKLDILLNGEPADALSSLIHVDHAYDFGRKICEKLKELIPRQQFDIAIQAAIGAKIIARETVKAPCAGLVFSQRSYSSVYPGTLIARIRKERA